MNEPSMGLGALLNAMGNAGPVMLTPDQAIASQAWTQQYMAVFSSGVQATLPPKNNFDLMVERKLEEARNAYAWKMPEFVVEKNDPR